MSAAEQLARGLKALELDLPAQAQQKLLAYVVLLAKWNKVYNLTAVRGETQMVSHHLLDSLAVLPHLPGVMKKNTVADIGSGGGMPGIPLAIARPDWQMALVDSNQKKISFLQQVKIELGLENISVHCQRVEAFKPTEKFAVVISRAFSDLGEFVQLSRHLLAPGGCFAAMKGLYPNEEIAQLPTGFSVSQNIPLNVPGVEGARHLILIRET